MGIKVTKKLNTSTEIEVEFPTNDLQDAIRAAGVILDFDGKCGMCSGLDVTLQTRVTKEKGFKYTEYLCQTCGARRPWGQYRDGGGFFLKPWEEKYTGNGQQQE
jgi:hypothetical protein